MVPSTSPRRASASALAVVLGLLAGCASAPSRPVEKVDCQSVYIFWPQIGGNHTSLLIRREDFPVPEALAGWPKEVTTDWAEVGFGSEEHFAARLRGRTMPMWRVLVPTPGDLLVQPFPWGGKPEDWRTATLGYLRIDLPEADYRKLLVYIKDSFAYDSQGAPIRRHDYAAGALYRSSLDYSFRRICHIWALDGLKEASVACTRGWPYDQQQIKDAFSANYRRPDVCR